MSTKEKYGMTTVDQQYYTQKVVEFILDNPGCTFEEIVRTKLIGRKRLSKILPMLKGKKVIVERMLNARNKMLYVNKAEPLYIVLTELREFEKVYFPMLRKIEEQHLRWRSGKRIGTVAYVRPGFEEESENTRDPGYVVAELLLDSILIFYEVMRLHVLRSIMIWSRVIRVKYTRELVNSIIITKLSRMQVRISELLSSIMLEDQNVIFKSLAREIFETEERVKDAFETLKSCGVEKEVQPVSDCISKVIMTEMARQKIYSESSRYKWDLGTDDVKGLTESMRTGNPTKSKSMDYLDQVLDMDFEAVRGR